jgi:hypothetical protein
MKHILYVLKDILSHLEPYKEQATKASSAYYKLQEQIEELEKLVFAFPSGSDPGMTLKQYAAIQLRVPRSGDPEVDAMIWESRKAGVMEKAMEGLLAFGYVPNDQRQNWYEAIAQESHSIAESMLVEWEKEAGL